ncbi:MAG: hypothetical protein M1143_01045 [Candidatus Thermoplasmatota archaeon]|nr:hypothetical protein [Candidatus Thermoplasmatota archaeon]
MTAPKPVPETEGVERARSLRAGLLIFLLISLFLVAFPIAGTFFAPSEGLAFGFSLFLVATFGGLIAFFTAVVWIAKPTRAYGPAKIAGSLAKVVALLVLGSLATVTYTVTSGPRVVTASIDGGTLFLLLLIAPVIGLVSGALMYLQDRHYPGRRLAVEFPGK